MRTTLSSFLCLGLAALMSCQVPVTTKDTTSAPPNNGSPQGGSTVPLPFEGADFTYASPLPATETITVTNTGAKAVPLVLYSGIYADAVADRKVKQSWPVPVNVTSMTIKASDIDHQNLWMVPQSGPFKDYAFRLTDKSMTVVMKPTPGNNWTLVCDGTYDSYNWKFQGTDKTAGYDWTTPGISDDRTVSTFHTERKGLVVGPQLRLINAPDWQLDGDGAHLVDATITKGKDAWMDGTIRLKYTGSAALNYIKATMRLRSADNTKRFFESTYASAVNLKTTGSSYETTAAVLGPNTLARFHVIEDLIAWGMTASDIAAIDLFIESSPLAANSYTSPGGVTIDGAPVWVSATGGYLAVTNNNATALKSYSGVFSYADSKQLEYTWDYPIVQQFDAAKATWGYLSTPLPAGAPARLSFYLMSTIAAGETFTIASMVHKWEGRSLAVPVPGVVSEGLDPAVKQETQRSHEERLDAERRASGAGPRSLGAALACEHAGP